VSVRSREALGARSAKPTAPERSREIVPVVVVVAVVVEVVEAAEAAEGVCALVVGTAFESPPPLLLAHPTDRAAITKNPVATFIKPPF
jgi:hypothetical protein